MRQQTLAYGGFECLHKPTYRDQLFARMESSDSVAGTVQRYQADLFQAQGYGPTAGRNWSACCEFI